MWPRNRVRITGVSRYAPGGAGVIHSEKPMASVRRLLLCIAIGLGVGTPLATVNLVNNTLRIPDRPRPIAAQAEAFARLTGSTWSEAGISAADGTRLDGWLFTPREANRALVLLLHGVADTRLGMLAHARYLLGAGYTVLVADSRGQGSSGGELVSYGVLEAGDVHAWADWALRTQRVEGLYGLGESMGAAVLIQSLAVEPRFRAIVAECSFSDFEEIAYYRLQQVAPLPRSTLWPVVHLGFAYTRLRYGLDLRRASPAQALRASHVPVLLIHGTSDSNIPLRHSEALARVNPGAVTLWTVEGAEHVESLFRAPEIYPQKVTQWFQGH
jgi:dipeptidyl aminopeptidase/acylaminoacyl peptidase